MFVLRTTVSTFYTGRAGQGWTSPMPSEAFCFTTRQEADRKAALFNGRTVLHGLTFQAEAA